MADHLRQRAAERDRLNAKATGPKYDAIIPDNHLIGVIAEQTFADAFGLPVHQKNTPGGDGGVDFTIAKGWTVDVKGATFVPPDLKVPTCKPLTAEVYVLCQVNLKRRWGFLLGWTTRDCVQSAEIKDYGYAYGPVYFVPRDELAPIDTLYEAAGVDQVITEIRTMPDGRQVQLRWYKARTTCCVVIDDTVVAVVFKCYRPDRTFWAFTGDDDLREFANHHQAVNSAIAAHG